MGRDYVVTTDCGCTVTYTHESDYRTSRYEPCKKHSDRKEEKARDAIVAAAKRQRDKNCNFASN